MKTNDFYKQIADEFILALEQDKLPWVKNWVGRESFGAYNLKTHKKYNGVNRLYLELLCQKRNYDTNAFLTFKQITQMGYTLEKGTSGIPVQFWFPFDTEKKKSLTWKEYNELVDKYHKKGELVPLKYVILERIFYVFNAKHIKTQDGESLEKKLIGEITHVQEDVALAENMLKEYIRIEGVGYEEKGTRAFYSPVTDSICVPRKKDFKSDSAFIQTLAHEISHSTGHEKRLNRKFGENFESENYAIEELRAEVASAFLCSDFNVPSMNCVLQNSKRYIQNWTEGLKDSPKKLLKAITDAEKIAEFVENKCAFSKRKSA